MVMRASTLSSGSAAIQNAVPRIEHREPVVRCEARFAFEKNTGAMKAAAAESPNALWVWKLRTAGCGDALQ